ncbi:methyl-accepting chemotaxis sensory transducer with Cache sensor [Epibacterium ulvae]|uniref:Methyl-accepting chemotaxis sensory transducer with Cache sensor n=1 Tax=Epibacterium ulvae TaxID=1156985 RepID=A0A1G5Q9Z2_9RHOB|nr:methyl-accepting chemotaxis protein [Epibacterium ulvae]SCZ58644.1 methyl-accepting chemotaxis sensory transducer with Cache sensor [Epibacterium ulvae]
MKILANMKLAWKLPLTIAIPAVVVVMISGLLQLKQTADAIDQEHRTAYTSYVESKGSEIERWLSDSQVDLLAIADTYGIQTALNEFSSAWDAYAGAVSDDLRRLYISDNPNPTGQKDELVLAKDGSTWSEVHNRHHVGLRSYQRARGYYDLFLFDTNGELIYSVFKEDDFALNFTNGVYAQSGLGEVFQEGIKLQNGQFYMTDIAPYAPSADAPAMFMSTPVFHEGQKIGVVAIQLPLDVMTEILSNSELIGTTGEVYLVDNNGKALTNSRREGGFSTLDSLPALSQITSALSGGTAYVKTATGVSGQDVVATTSDVKTPRGDLWGLVFEIDRSEAMQFTQHATITTALATSITGLVLCLLAWLTVRSLIQRVEILAHEMEQISEQNYGQEIAGQRKQDEVGFISRTLAKLQVRLRDGAEAEAREKIVQKNNKNVVNMLSEGLVDLAKGDFRNQITETFPEEHVKLRDSLNNAMTGLNDVVLTVRDTADSINRGAQEISGSADELSQRTESQAATLEQTAAALEEVTASVRSATEHVESVEKTVGTARSKALESGEVVGETIEAMTEIEQSSQKISQIINVIDDIAFQTNLLALNAGVEAARAGEAGRGFAVVASEVRGLAQRSADAAMEIKSLIEKSGQQVGRGVKMVGRTGDALTVIIEQVQDISGLVSQIAQSSREQSTALSEINTGMIQLDQVTQGNAAMVEENTAAAHLLRGDASKLIHHVDQFKTSGSNSKNSMPPIETLPAVQQSASEFDEDPFEETEPFVHQAANDKWTDF